MYLGNGKSYGAGTKTKNVATALEQMKVYSYHIVLNMLDHAIYIPSFFKDAYMS